MAVIATIVTLERKAAPLKDEKVFDLVMQWLSRTIAVVILMVGPGLAGVALDKRFESWLWTPAGFLLGMLLGTTALVTLARKLAPAGRGKPLSLDEQVEQDQDQDDVASERKPSAGSDK